MRASATCQFRRCHFIEADQILICIGTRRNESVPLRIEARCAKSFKPWNRTNFIRTAIRNQLERQSDATRTATVKKQLELGISHFSRAKLEELRRAGEMLEIRVLGLASIADDVPTDLARATIASLTVLGALHLSRPSQAFTRSQTDCNVKSVELAFCQIAA